MSLTFNENYGYLPTSTLRLVKKFNVSPADFDLILDSFMFNFAELAGGAASRAWLTVNDHILQNSANGYYQPRMF